MTSPSIVCIGAMWSFPLLSIARLHWWAEMSSAPMAAKFTSMRAAKTCSMISLEVASIRASSTYILAGIRTLLPWLSRTPVLIEHGIALARSGDGSRFTHVEKCPVFFDEITVMRIHDWQGLHGTLEWFPTWCGGGGSKDNCGSQIEVAPG